jgi:Tfp pilus assembly protein PilF
MAECFYKRGDVAYALADYHQALDLDPHDNTVRTRIADVHVEYAQQLLTENKYEVSLKLVQLRECMLILLGVLVRMTFFNRQLYCSVTY